MTQLQDLKRPAEFPHIEHVVTDRSLPHKRGRKEKRATEIVLGVTQFYDRLT